MADKKSTFNISQATGTLPNGLVITYDGSDESIKNSPENQAAQNAEKKMYERDQNPVPKFTLEDGKVSLSGGKINLSHPVVTEMETALSNAFRGADFTDKDVATAFQKAATKANEQIQAQLNYEEYEDFLDHSGFSDSAYRNYSSARQEFEKPNVTSSTANVTTYDKNGKLVKKSIKEWFDYWKKEYNPEDRGQLWLKSLERAYNPTSDEDLYAAIPAILMGTNKGQNWLQGFFQLVNPFDGKGADAPTVTPVNGFDDTNGVSVGIQSAVAEFGRILPQTGEMVNNPWGDLGATTGEGRYNFKERFGTEFTNADLPEIENEEDFQWYKSLANKSDQELRDIFGSDRIPRQVAVISDPAFSSYESYKEFRDRVTGENAYTAAKSWDQNLQESIERFATYAPNEATVGVAAGQIARIAAEQFALSLLTGGALSTSNIMKSIGDLGVKGGKALGIIKTGQELAATSSNTAKILSAMASGSAEGLNVASKIIYGLGKIGTWAVREVGEDAIRGLIDDVLVGNSLDSQGNLDGSKFLENVYMNAIMAAIGKAPGTISKAIFTVLDADKTIDGVKIPVGAKTQLNKLAQAASGSADSAVKAIDEDGHPIITRAGKDERLDQVTLTKENANKLVPEQAPTKTLEEAVAEGDDAGKAIENIAKEAGMDTPLKPGDNTKIENAPDPEATKNKIERKLNDDDIRRKFPNGKVSINGEEYVLDVKNANLGDLASANGSTIKNFGDGASKLAASAKQGLRSFQEALNGVLQHADEFAKGWKDAVEKFASDNGVAVRDVIIALRDLRIDGTESIPGLKQLWEEHWAPYANQLLDAQDNLTKIKTNRQNYYQRDMVAGTVKIDGGKVSVDQSTVSNLLGIDSDFDLTASSRKANKQKITDDKLETNPELLAKEFVLSRAETIKKYSKQGKIISAMREALDDGEELTQSEAAESLRATKKIGDDIRNSKEVQDIADSVADQKTLDNVDNLNFEMDAKVNSDPEVKRIDGEIEKQKADIESKKAQLEETNKPSEDGKIPESNLREAPWNKKNELGAKGYKYVESNADIPGIKDEHGSVVDWVRKGGNDDEVIKRYNMLPKEVKDYVEQDKNFQRLVDRYGLPTAFTRVGVDFPISMSLIDKTYGDYLWSKNNGASGGEGQSVKELLKKSKDIYDKKMERANKATDPADKASLSKRAGAEKAARDRLISNNLTAKERSNFKKKYDSNFVGKKVIVDGKDAVVKKPSMFGKVGVEFLDGTKKTVDNVEVKPKYTSKADVEADMWESLIKPEIEATLGVKLDNGIKYDSNAQDLSKEISDGEANLKKLNDERAKAVEQAKKRISNEGPKTEAQQTAENKQIVNSVADTTKATADQRQDAFEKAANKSNAAELISDSSKYKKRAKHQATQNPIGVNFMPGNPFGKFASWINDNFIKSQSIQIKEGDRIYSAYSGGYSLYAESTSWARQIILDIRDGKTLTDAIYRVLQQNGVKVEPTEYAIEKYGAKTSPQKDFEKASAIAERLSKSRLWGKAVKDGKVVNTELLGAMLAKELRRQGASEFFRFLKKSDFSTFTKGQQKWLNAQAYKMIASFDPKAGKRIKAGIQKAMGLVMGAKYRSNMYGNLKNAQLQLTEIQRLFTLNGLGDFAKTIKRLITDSDFRTKISDAAYIYANDSIGQGLTKQDVEMMKQIIDSNLAAADASTMTPKGIITAINTHFQKGAKAAIDGADNDLLGAIQGAEYFKNYMLLAGIVQSAETKNLSGMAADAYIRNRFNTEALAGTNISRIGLTDSALGRLTFMYLGFPIRELTLQAHIIKGGGTLGGSTKFDKVIGGIAYAEKMLGAKGLVWALEAPWGYKFADVIGYDPFGLTDNRSDTEDNKNVDFWAGLADFGIQNNPILQGAIGSAFVDVYMAYREAYEDAKDEWLETHDSLEGFDWTLDDAPNEQIWQTFGAGFTPGYTAFSRAANEAQDLDRGFRISSTGNRLYETNQDPGSALWGMIMGRTNTRNAMNYYQTPDPIRGLAERGLPGLGQAFERAMPFRLNRLEGAQYGDRNFREFDPTDSYSYSDWFDGSWADEQNWITGYYAFREEAEEIRDRANEGVNQSNALEKIASRETELADLRERVERYVQAYLDKHPEGISNAKMQQVQRIFNMDLPDAGNTLNRVLGDYSDYEKNYAANRVAQGNFPSPYGFSSTPYTDQDGVSKGDYKYARNAQLENILQTQQYGVQSNVGRVIAQLDDTLVPTPFGSMSFSDYRKKVQNEISKEYSKSKVDYDHISDLQSQYLDVFDMIIRPIFSTYGSGILQAGKSSDVMQQFSSMLNGLIPSDEYRVDKKGRRIRQSTPYMTVDIKKWLQKNYGNYPARNTTDNDSEARLRGIRNDMDAGRVAVARAKAIAFIEDIREGRASIDRDRLAELQNILRGGYDKNSITGGGNLNTGLNR